jgi:glycosyltransferase involved in cell wall biosynthesis
LLCDFSFQHFKFQLLFYMRWLIVEDALRDRKGHWFEYLGTFARELRALGDDVTILADSSAEAFLVEQLQVNPILPASIWRRMGDGSGALRRYLRVPVHAWQTYRAIKKYIRRNEKFDVIFVPTVIVHHLLGWTWLVKRTLKKTTGRVLLFFPNTPVELNPGSGEPSWQPAPTAKLFCRLIRSLRDEVKQGRVILGAETEPMRDALTQLTGVPFTYFPHPVAAGANAETLKTENQKPQDQISDVSISKFQTSTFESHPTSDLRPPASGSLTFGSYGGARYEKGSDVLVAAVDEFCRRHPDSRARFVLQCVGGDVDHWKKLQGNPKVRLVPGYFASGEYARQLAATDVLLLPYRRSSYGLRVSRVVIEAMVHGIPVVATRGTTLASQAEQFGAAVLCEDENAESLVTAIETVERNYKSLYAQALERQNAARIFFSVNKFSATLTGNISFISH